MMRTVFERCFNKLWYHYKLPALLLWPVSFLYCLVVRLRIWLYQQNILKSEKPAVPVIVVGNLTVGGTGKTPLVLWLAIFLRESGYLPGIICSGYRGQGIGKPLSVNQESDPESVGDEAVLLAKRSNCPVVACRDRVSAARELMRQDGCNLVLCDDGLQHYQLQRDIEILLLDAERGFGNGYCLPAGPLREPVKRLKSVDFVVSKGRSTLAKWHMETVCNTAYALENPHKIKTLTDFRQQTIHAIAGIANPSAFFTSLRTAGLTILEEPFPDHHQFLPGELKFDDHLPVLMTEKDAVKCRLLETSNCWVVPLEIQMPDNFGTLLLSYLARTQTEEQVDFG
jgi:tetraacyldisaccharide 4'-kinase